jgi:predicted amidohydrolase YtcJ
MAAQRIVANPQLGWFHSGWEAEMNFLFAPGRQGMIGRWRDLLDAGVRMIGSTDFPFGHGEVGPVPRTLYVATTRIGDDGTAPSPVYAAQRISIGEAMHALTVAGAWALGQARLVGSIEVGKLADFTVLTQDPAAMAVTDLLDVGVAMTMVGGEVSYLGAAGAGLHPPGTPPPLVTDAP